jgi:hypothetical protein
MKNQPVFARLKEIYLEVKNHNDFTRKSIPFFVSAVREIRVELLKVAAEQAEQISRDVSDAMRLIHISEREDLNNIQNYPDEIPKYLKRVKDTLMTRLAFINK